MATANPQWTWFQQNEIHSALTNCKSMLQMRELFDPNRAPIPLTCAASTFLLINLNDLLQKLRSVNRTIAFADDMVKGGPAQHVTELINNARNAACHLTSANHVIETNRFTFVFVAGKNPVVFKVGEIEIGCDYADDIAIIFGPNRVYLKRHIVRALQEAEKVVVEAGMLD